MSWEYEYVARKVCITFFCQFFSGEKIPDSRIGHARNTEKYDIYFARLVK